MTTSGSPPAATPWRVSDDPDAVPVRDAATVMLVRDGDHGGLEVCMLQRNLNSDFVGGAYVFPGGGVDDHDSAVELEAVCRGRTDAQASAFLGVERAGLAFWVAGIRECFEEAGILLACWADGDIVRFDDPVVDERFIEHRRAIDSGERRIVEVCVEEGLHLAVDAMHYFSRWITPLGAPRRYDTRFFVARAPVAQVPLHDDHEVIANLWVRPQDALARSAAGEFQLIFPTIRSLEALALFATADDLVDHAARIGDVPAILPRLVAADGGMRLVLPGDEHYDPVTGARVQ